MKARFIILTGILVLMGVAPPWLSAQAVLPSRELVASGLGAVDDVEVLPSGDILLSFPNQGVVSRQVPGPQGSAWVPVASGLILAMTLDPGGGALWTADYGTGEVRRVDLQTGQVTQTLTGFGHPIDLVFRDADTLLVGGMSTPDNINGVGSVYQVDLQAPGGPQTTLLATGFQGALDMEVNAQGRIFVVAYSSPTLDEVDPLTGAVTPVATGLLQPSDIIPGPGNTLYVCTLVAAEILRIDPTATTPSWTQVGALIGETPGPGCEDMAFDSQGQILVAMTDASLRRVVVANEIVHEGTALAGLTFHLLLDAPALAGWQYQIVASLQPGALPIAGTPFVLPITVDDLFLASLAPSSPFFSAFSGPLDPQGRALALVHVPLLPSGTTIPVYFGAVFADLTAPAPQLSIPDFLQVNVFTL